MPPVRSGLILEAKATVLSCTYRYAKLRDVDFESWWDDKSYFLVTFRYEVDGEVLVSDFESSVPYAEGETFDLMVDPYHPQINSVYVGTLGPLHILSKICLYALAAAAFWWIFHHFDLPGE